MASSEEQPNAKDSEEPAEEHLPPAPGEPIEPIPASNPSTPEGYIEGIGTFAQGLKRMFRRWRQK